MYQTSYLSSSEDVPNLKGEPEAPGICLFYIIDSPFDRDGGTLKLNSYCIVTLVQFGLMQVHISHICAKAVET